MLKTGSIIAHNNQTDITQVDNMQIINDCPDLFTLKFDDNVTVQDRTANIAQINYYGKKTTVTACVTETRCIASENIVGFNFSFDWYQIGSAITTYDIPHKLRNNDNFNGLNDSLMNLNPGVYSSFLHGFRN